MPAVLTQTYRSTSVTFFGIDGGKNTCLDNLRRNYGNVAVESAQHEKL